MSTFSWWSGSPNTGTIFKVTFTYKWHLDAYFVRFFTFFFFTFVWPLLPTHCRCRVLVLHLIVLNGAHTHTPHSVGLSWTKDRPVAETSTRHRTTFTRERRAWPRRNSNPQSQNANGRRPTPEWTGKHVEIKSEYRHNARAPWLWQSVKLIEFGGKACRNTGCPTTYQTRQFFNNFTTNEDIATKFEADLPHCVRNMTTS